MCVLFITVPIAPSDPNRTFVVGNIFGQIRSITLNGNDEQQPDHNNESMLGRYMRIIFVFYDTFVKVINLLKVKTFGGDMYTRDQLPP